MKFKVGEKYICKPDDKNMYYFTVKKIKGDKITYVWYREKGVDTEFTDSIKYLNNFEVIKFSKLHKVLE